MTENLISYICRGCIFDVYNTYGPGLFESVYQAALMEQLKDKKVLVTEQFPVYYHSRDGSRLLAFKADILIENKVIVEIKSVETIHEVHHKQIITYLKLSGLKLGLLVNFNTENINKSIYRKVNGL